MERLLTPRPKGPKGEIAALRAVRHPIQERAALEEPAVQVGGMAQIHVIGQDQHPGVPRPQPVEELALARVPARIHLSRVIGHAVAIRVHRPEPRRPAHNAVEEDAIDPALLQRRSQALTRLRHQGLQAAIDEQVRGVDLVRPPGDHLAVRLSEEPALLHPRRRLGRAQVHERRGAQENPSGVAAPVLGAEPLHLRRAAAGEHQEIVAAPGVVLRRGGAAAP
ncbi:MAG: hypothetical protein ACOX6M_07900 [Armatimonadota bacterium]